MMNSERAASSVSWSVRKLSCIILLVAQCLIAGCSTPGFSLSGGGDSGFGVISADFCDTTRKYAADHQDRLLRFAAVVREALDASGSQVALLSRSGLDLQRLGITFTHMGIAVKADDEPSWKIRQLYYACDEARPRLFDEGLAGFLFATEPDAIGHAAIVRLPPRDAKLIRESALDTPRALDLVADDYSANAYPFSTRYQNCNQWVIELLATALDSIRPGCTQYTSRAPASRRQFAQDWLAANGYRPQSVALDSHLLKFAATLSPMIHLDDHPVTDRDGLRFRVSLPASIETFVQQRLPGATRTAFCHTKDQIVIRDGWDAIDPQCTPRVGDRTIPLLRTDAPL